MRDARHAPYASIALVNARQNQVPVHDVVKAGALKRALEAFGFVCGGQRHRRRSRPAECCCSESRPLAGNEGCNPTSNERYEKCLHRCVLLEGEEKQTRMGKLLIALWIGAGSIGFGRFD